MIVARCQRSGARPSGIAESASVTGEALLAPWVAVHVVAPEFPETRLVLRRELNAVHPFRRFPEIQMRHEQSGRSTVFRRERLAGKAQRDHRLRIDEIRGRHVGRIAVEGVYEGELRR